MTIAEMKKMDATTLAEELKCGTYYAQRILDAKDADTLENVVLATNCKTLILHGTRTTWTFINDDIIPYYMACWIVYEQSYTDKTLEVYVVEPC